MTYLTDTPAQPTQNEPGKAQGPGYGFGTTLDMPFDEAITRTTEALKAQGFGVLTTIDVQATMKAKLNVEFERYVILGACNPPLAHRALTAEHNVGLLLPCNVVVYETSTGDKAGQTRVEIADPLAMMSIIQNPTLHEVAAEARARLEQVVASLQPAK